LTQIIFSLYPPTKITCFYISKVIQRLDAIQRYTVVQLGFVD
jgi:hypothetical protein